MPGELVGDWNGGPGDSADFWLRIERDSAYRLENEEDGWIQEGTVGALGALLTFYPSPGHGSPWSCDWALLTNVGLEILQLESSTFVRA